MSLTASEKLHENGPCIYMMLSVQLYTLVTASVVNMVGMSLPVWKYCSCLNTELSTHVVTLAFSWQCNTETVLDVFLWHSLAATFIFFIPASHSGFLLAILLHIYLSWPVQLTTVQHSIPAQSHQMSHLHKVCRDHQHEHSISHLASLGWTIIILEMCNGEYGNYTQKYKSSERSICDVTDWKQYCF